MSNRLIFELVLPCYNESRSLKALLERAVHAAREAGLSSSEFQLVLVENGSKDNSSEVMDQLQSSELGSWFRKVLVPVNRGYGFGLWSGLQTTTATYVGWSHADQQCDPKNAFEALSIIRAENCPMLVKGVRTGRQGRDRFVSRVFELISRIVLGLKIGEINAQPKVFAAELLKEIKNPPFTFAFDLYVLYQAAKAGYRIKTIQVFFPPRIHGVSNWAGTLFGRYKTILGMIRYMFELRKSEGRL